MVFKVLALIGIAFAEFPASDQQFEVVSIRPNSFACLTPGNSGMDDGARSILKVG
jgi:hypothetical protein